MFTGGKVLKLKLKTSHVHWRKSVKTETEKPAMFSGGQVSALKLNISQIH
jgi:hypothetical protein